MIEQMRLDFPVAAKAEGWSVEEQADIGLAIKDAIADGDGEALADWAKGIPRAAAQGRAWCERVREAEANIKAVRKESA